MLMKTITCIVGPMYHQFKQYTNPDQVGNVFVHKEQNVEVASFYINEDDSELSISDIINMEMNRNKSLNFPRELYKPLPKEHKLEIEALFLHTEQMKLVRQSELIT